MSQDSELSATVGNLWIRMRPQLWWDNFQACVDDRQWRQHFRISRNTFLYLVESVRSLMEKRVTNFRQPISVKKRVAVGLWRLASGSDYRNIQELFGVGRSSACIIFQEFVTVLVLNLRPKFLQRPTPAQFLDIVRGFRDVWGFPQCAGAIDGTHIPIIAPVEHRNSYYNRKGWYSLVCQAVCDHRYRFWDVYVGWPGRTHDARVFSNSPVYQDGQRGRLCPDHQERFGNVDVPLFLIGDPAYPLLSWLMKAYPENANTPEMQQHFNYRLSRARMVIECAFGRLKGRWRILMKRNDNDLALVPTIVMACCILHNMCETREEAFEADTALAQIVPHPHVVGADVGDQRQARNERDSLCAYLNANRLV